MSVQTAPLTHKPTLGRMLCPHCQSETLHKCYVCLHCGANNTPVRVQRKAFGARLVIKRETRPR